MLEVHTASSFRELRVNPTVAQFQTSPMTTTATRTPRERIGQRRRLAIPGRLTWRDASGTLRFASVMTRDVSEVDVFVECQMPASIPLYRLVHFQIERGARDASEVPGVLKRGKLLSAVYRIGPYRSSTGTPQGYALRLLVEPAHTAEDLTVERVAARN